MQKIAYNYPAYTLLVSSLLFSVSISSFAKEKFIPWKMQNYAIEEPLGGLTGNAKRGREIVKRKDKGNCLACHSAPIAEESFHGTVGPTLKGIGARLTVGEIRLRVADETMVNPATIMPGFYKNPKQNNRVIEDHWGKTVLTAQELEDVVAYLVTLK